MQGPAKQSNRASIVLLSQKQTPSSDQQTTPTNKPNQSSNVGLCNALGNIFRLIIVAAGILALILELYTAMSCELISVKGGEDDGSSIGVFFLSAEEPNQCMPDLYEMDDALVTFARSALSISMISGFVALLMVTFEWLFCEVCCAGALEGLAFLLAWTSGAAVFAFYGTDVCLQDGVQCEFTEASGALTAAVVLFLGCGVLLCCTPQPDPICRSSK